MTEMGMINAMLTYHSLAFLSGRGFARRLLVALREFGNVAGVQERTRGERGCV